MLFGKLIIIQEFKYFLLSVITLGLGNVLSSWVFNTLVPGSELRFIVLYYHFG